MSGQDFSSAGQGGSVTLASGVYRNVNGVDVTDYSGFVNVSAGSTIDLRVAANDNTDGSVNAAAVAANAALGDFSGTLEIEAPRIGETGVEVQPINGSIIGASSIAVVGNQVYIPANGLINGTGADTSTVIDTLIGPNGTIMTDGNNFLGAAGAADTLAADPNYWNMFNQIFGNLDAAGKSVANIEAGVEIVNPTGDLVLGPTLLGDSNEAFTTAAGFDWDLSGFRFGPNSAPGVLTMRAAGNLVFNAALSDGFNSSPGTLWTATLLAQNPLLPIMPRVGPIISRLEQI